MSTHNASIFRQLFDRSTSTYTYLLADPETREALLIDPVHEQFDRDRKLLRELDLTLVHTLETHVHADHVTAASRFREALRSRSVVAARGGASCGDLRVSDGDVVRVGSLALEVRTTPGHTDGCLSYYESAAGRVFTGDALLIRGCGRTDFQNGDAETLYASVHEKLFTLPDATYVYPGHDYKGHSRSTIGEEKAHNPRLGAGKDVAAFIEIMNKLELAQPARIDEAVPANLSCGLRRAFEAAPGQPAAEVDPSWVHARMDHLLLVDVRSAEECRDPELLMLEHARNVPLETLADEAADWERGAPVVAICRSGRRSMAAAAALRDMGFLEVASMRGGMQGWYAEEKARLAAEAD